MEHSVSGWEVSIRIVGLVGDLCVFCLLRFVTLLIMIQKSEAFLNYTIPKSIVN